MSTQHKPDHAGGELLGAALSYAAAGFPVLILKPLSKRPFINKDGAPPGLPTRGVKNATTHASVIRMWWTRCPTGNIGIATGAEAGVFVLDIDPRSNGDAALEGLEAKYGALPETVIVYSGRGDGGRHLYFRHPGFRFKNKSIAPGIDVKTDGGYVLAPPSTHPDSGNPYFIDTPEIDDPTGPAFDLATVAEPPAWLVQLLSQQHETATAGAPGNSTAIKEGGRNTTLTSLAGSMRRRGMEQREIEAGLLEVNRNRCVPRLPESEVSSIAASVARYPSADGAAGCRFPLTDVGNAERFAAQHRRDVRYCHSTGRFYAWTGRRWELDLSGDVMRRAVRTVRTIYAEAAAAADKNEACAIAGWAENSESRPRLDAMVALSRSQPGIPILPRELDADQWLLNVENGTIDLRSGKLRDHSRGDLITRLAPVRFDARARCPLFDRFLDTTFSGDAALIEFVVRFLGMCLTGDVTEQILPIFHGEGSNGESVLLDTVSGLLGDYASEAAPDLLAARKGERHPTELADLFCRRLVVASETEEGAVLRLQLVKRLTGDARIKGRFMRQDFFEFNRTHKLVLVTNSKPLVREDTEAAWRRLRLVPFAHVVPKSERDKKLLHKLRLEWPGILNKLVAGCIRWQEHELTEPEAVLLATEKYRTESDVMALFVDECCFRSPTAWVGSRALRLEYERWNEDRGTRAEVGKAFASRLRCLGFSPDKQHGERGWEGLGLCVD